MADYRTFTSPLTPTDCLQRLEQLAANRSFYAKSDQAVVRITFTGLKSAQTGSGAHVFWLHARCSTYRGLGLLYIRARGSLEPLGSTTRVRFAVGLGAPSGALERVLLVVGNLFLLFIGAVLIVSALQMPLKEGVFRFAFLPLIYLLFALNLWILYEPAISKLPDLLYKALTIPARPASAPRSET